SYLLVNVMRVNPLRSEYDVTVTLDRSGGLQPGNDVTLRGHRIGKIDTVDLIDEGQAIAVKAVIDKSYKIPVDTMIQVAALSAAGEQYIDFRPNSDAGPFLRDGAVIEFNPEQIKTPVPVWAVLDDTSALIGQVNPQQFKTILAELDIALGAGPDQLRGLVNGVSLAVAGLHSLLPQTVNLIANLRVIADTTSNAQPDLQTLTSNSGSLLQQFNNANAELQSVLDNSPAQFEALGAVLDKTADPISGLDNSPAQFEALGAVLDKTADPISGLAANFVAITRAAQLRQPALRLLFPSLAQGLGAIAVPAHDGEFHTILDIWPRPTCNYNTEYRRNEEVQDGSIPKWNYCVNPPADLQIRGSANAPRPNVPNNGAQMPPGVDPNERTPIPAK
ncbi:MlaD family protein, partial [Streptomyces californicus]|uniref:MlaD family protein n=1 Tax=Streptomyces californicus TaxID=67351 RepID=UPI0036B05BA5